MWKVKDDLYFFIFLADMVGFNSLCKKYRAFCQSNTKRDTFTLPVMGKEKSKSLSPPLSKVDDK